MQITWWPAERWMDVDRMRGIISINKQIVYEGFVYVLHLATRVPQSNLVNIFACENDPIFGPSVLEPHPSDDRSPYSRQESPLDLGSVWR